MLVRRVTGPQADEFFFLCRPQSVSADIQAQTKSIYTRLLERLLAEGASFDAITRETLFVRDVRRDLDAILDTRRAVTGNANPQAGPPVMDVIGQPPLRDGAALELSVHAVVPRRGERHSPVEVSSNPVCRCESCAVLPGRVVRVGEQTHMYSGNVYGAGANAFDEVSSMFQEAEGLLKKAGMNFSHVIRTWIYLRDMDRDYAEFNRGRREFFQSRGIELQPASTAVGGVPFPDGHDFSLSFFAIESSRPVHAEAMSTPTLNEARTYGSDFSRGLKIVEANKIALYLSGTASLDETGQTVHEGDLEGQVKRMLVNISSLLAVHGASFDDLASAVTYVKHASHAPVVHAILKEHGFEGFPCALVEAPICRPELLCETEAVAFLPLLEDGDKES